MGGEGTHKDMECNIRNEDARRTDLGSCSGATRQTRWGRKKKVKKGSIVSDTFLAMAENCRVRTQHTLFKTEASQPSEEGSSRYVRNSNGNPATVWECLEICQKYGTPETHGRKFIIECRRMWFDGL